MWVLLSLGGSRFAAQGSFFKSLGLDSGCKVLNPKPCAPDLELRMCIGLEQDSEIPIIGGLIL